MESRRSRAVELAKRQVETLKLDLNGLTVLTECASNAYGYTAFMALIAGARVIALGKDSTHGKFENSKKAILDMVEREKLTNFQIDFFENELPDNMWAKAEIITNSGFLRPFTREKISRMGDKAVLPLMWETWELRPNELDIKACQDFSIPVIGTNEHFPGADMFGYPGMLAIKLILESGLELINNIIVLLGGGLTGRLIAETFTNLKLDFIWFTENGNEKNYFNHKYSDLNLLLEQENLDLIFCADHVTMSEIVGRQSTITFSDIKKRFKNIAWCHLMGPIDTEELKSSGIDFYPKSIKPFGYMSYDTDNLGWGPVIILNSAGLKVGEIAARSRMAGNSVENAIRETVEYGIGQDFEEGFMNFRLK